MKHLVLFICSVIFQQVIAGEKYPKDHYLITIPADFSFQDGEKHLLDSLLYRYHHAKNDEYQLEELKALSEQLPSYYLWIRYNDILYSRTHHSKEEYKEEYYLTALNNYGYQNQYILNDWTKARHYYHKMLDFARKSDQPLSEAVALNNLAFMDQHTGNMMGAIRNYTSAGLIFEKQKKYQGMCAIYNNLGSIYFDMDEFDLAKKNFLITLQSAKKARNIEMIARASSAMATIYIQEKQYDKALYFTNAAIRNNKKVLNADKILFDYFNLVQIYTAQNRTNEARHYLELIQEKLPGCKDDFTRAKLNNQLAEYFLTRQDWDRVKTHCDTVVAIATRANLKDLELAAYQRLTNYFEAKNQLALAYKYVKKSQAIESELKSDAIKKAIFKNEYKFEFEKRKAEQDLINEKKDLIRQNEKKQQQLIIWIIAIALIGSILFIYFIYKSYSNKKHAAQILELKNNEIQQQKDLVEEKQLEIIDSINYAKRIQSAVLTDTNVWTKISPEYFLLFQPRDIVSGDFYWAHLVNDNLAVFALADCTGHGVPGGFMSMLGTSFLNEIVIENKIYSPEIILNKLREKIIRALEQKDGEYQQKDGMDISLCVWDKERNSLHFAGANNHLWLVRNNELHEFKADKMPIGSFIKDHISFTKTEFELHPGDIIYLSTDGFPDQFGGEKSKKFKVKNLQELLLLNAALDMSEQKQALETAFEQWKGTMEQVDDVAILGVKIT